MSSYGKNDLMRVDVYPRRASAVTIEDRGAGERCTMSCAAASLRPRSGRGSENRTYVLSGSPLIRRIHDNGAGWVVVN